MCPISPVDHKIINEIILKRHGEDMVLIDD